MSFRASPDGLRFSRIGLLPVPADVPGLGTAGFIRRSADYRSGPAEALGGPAFSHCEGPERSEWA
jgi:hypothetical protein